MSAALLSSRDGMTHVITIPGTRYECHLKLNDAGETAKQEGRYASPPIKVEALLKSLARTTVKGPGKRRVKAQPVLMTIREFEALTTAKAA
jgi:hypothetical protein